VNNYKKHNNLNNQNNTCSPCDTLRRRGSGTTGRPAEQETPPGPTQFRYGKPPSRASDTARADALPGPRVLRLRRGAAPAVIAGGGGGLGKEAVCWSQSGGMDVAKRSTPSLPGTEPIRISPPPCLPSTKRHPPACRQGSIPELKPLELQFGEGREGPGEARGALWADAVIPAGGTWGKPRSGQAWPLGASLAGKPCR
jgi:hypothetical protein